MWTEPPDRILYDNPQNHRQTHGSQAERHSAAVAQADARGSREDGEVAGNGGSRGFPVSRGAGERAANEVVPQRCAADMATADQPPEPTWAMELDEVSGAAWRLNPGGYHCPSMAA